MERMLTTAAEPFLTEDIENIVVGQGTDHTFRPQLEEAGYVVYGVPPLVRIVDSARYLKEIVQRHDVDVIHIHTEGNYLRTTIAARLALGKRGALVRTIHSIFDARGRWYWRRRVQATLADLLVASVVVPSPDVAENERKFGRSNVRLILNWVDPRFFALRERRQRAEGSLGPPIAVIVGNCSPIKQHELALGPIMSAGHLVWHVGDESGANPGERTLLDQFEDAGRLISRGTQAPDRALAEADYFVFPSSHEGMGVALAEAIAAGVPAFVNDVPGVQWARGLMNVVFVTDTESAWRGAILSWPLSEKTKEGTRESPNLSASRGARQYAEIYRQALGEGLRGS